VIFPAVDYQLLMDFIQRLDFTRVDIDFFENLKNIFSFSQDNIPKKRWTTLPAILTLDQLRDIISLLNTFSPGNNSPIDKIQEIIFTYHEFEIQINQLQNHLPSEREDKNQFAQKVNELENELQLHQDHLNSEKKEKMTITERKEEFEKSSIKQCYSMRNLKKNSKMKDHSMRSLKKNSTMKDQVMRSLKKNSLIRKQLMKILRMNYDWKRMKGISSNNLNLISQNYSLILLISLRLLKSLLNHNNIN
jgi:hypothetical protein